MPDKPKSDGAERGRMALLLAALLFALLVAPILEQAFGGHIMIYAGGTAVLIVGAFVNIARRWLFISSTVLAVLAVSTLWSTLVLDYPVLFVASCVLEAAFYGIIAVVLLTRILQKFVASLDSVFGALCVYLLLGLAWAQLYWATARMEAASFSGGGQAVMSPIGRVQADEATDGVRTAADRPVPPFSRMVYFSFVTMSTLGYGDIAPKTPIAQTLAWMQSVLGQFYLAVLVAWLVGALPRREAVETARAFPGARRSKDGPQPSDSSTNPPY
ncbi:MAG: two pore domain potassium channel family protein [Planctomycetes bacterium]|nr:two pore domain potassium channel family protein [Planctomycetota bacterium]